MQKRVARILKVRYTRQDKVYRLRFNGGSNWCYPITKGDFVQVHESEILDSFLHRLSAARYHRKTGSVVTSHVPGDTGWDCMGGTNLLPHKTESMGVREIACSYAITQYCLPALPSQLTHVYGCNISEKQKWFLNPLHSNASAKLTR